MIYNFVYSQVEAHIFNTIRLNVCFSNVTLTFENIFDYGGWSFGLVVMWELMFRRSWVWIPAPFTGWTFFTFICCKNCNVYLKRWKNEKETGDGPFINIFDNQSLLGIIFEKAPFEIFWKFEKFLPTRNPLSLSLSLSLYVIVGCQNFDVFCETVAKHFLHL